MAAPDTDLVKLWCRIDGTEFDGLLPTMIAGVTALASHETGVDYTAEDMPEAVQQWCCAQISYWINNPDAAGSKEMKASPFLMHLLDPYRSYTWTVPA